MKMLPLSNCRPTVVFFTGPVGSGKDTLLGKLGDLLPKNLTRILKMEEVIDALCASNATYQALRDAGELLPSTEVSAGFHSLLLRATIDENIKFIFCGGACRSILEVRTYLDMLSKRRKNVQIHYVSLRCPRNVCVERDNDRAKHDSSIGKPLRSDWGPEKAGSRWDKHVQDEADIMSAVHQYPSVQVHSEIDASGSKENVLKEIWKTLGFTTINELASI